MTLVNKISRYPEVQALAWQELCFEETDVPASDTAQRIMEIVERKNSKNKDSQLKEVPTPISDAFYCFSHWYPISENNRKNIIEFFKNEKNTKLWGEVFSSIYLLSWDENSLFIDSFLKNWWKNDITKFVEYVLNQLEKYPFVVDFDYDEIKEIKEKWIIENTKAFIYKKWTQKSMIVTNKEWAVFALGKAYEKLEYRKNWTFCWIKKEWKTSYWEYIKFVWNEYNIIWKIDNISEIPNISDEDWNLIYTSRQWKKWLQRFEIQDIDNEELVQKRLVDKLKDDYDSIKIENWLVFACKNWEKGEKTYEIYLHSGFKKILQFEDIKWYEYVEWVENKTIIKFLTPNWASYYEIDNSWKIFSLDYLQNVQAKIRPKLESEIYKNINLWRSVFIKYKTNRNCLVVKNWEQYFYHEFEWKDLEIISANIWLDNKVYSTYNINWKIYIYDKNNKNLYLCNRKYRTVKERTLKDIEDDLEPINLVQFDKNS